MICGSLSNHLATFLRTLFSAIDTFLDFRDWKICWVIFNKYLVCFENNDSKCVNWSFVDDNMNNRIFFTNKTSTSKCLFLWQMIGDSVLVIIYDTHACTSGAVISRMNKSVSIRLYSNRLSLSNMFGELAFSLNLWLNVKCGNQPGIDVSLMMCGRFFVIFQQTVGTDVLVSINGNLFLSLLLYNRCRGRFKPLLLLWPADIPHSGLITLLNILFYRRDFLLFLLFGFRFVLAYTPWFFGWSCNNLG